MAQDWDLFAPVLSTDVEKLQKTQTAPSVSVRAPGRRPEGKRAKPPAAAKLPESQEEIDAWIAERRRRFPTQQRVAARAELEREREARGAIDTSAPAGGRRKGKPAEMSTRAAGSGHSMIDKLMDDDDARRERSIVLQCFRYFNTHGFLQDGAGGA